MEEETEDADRESDESHHEPPVPVESRRLLLQPVAVHLAVRRQVLQALVRVEDLPLLLRVLVVHPRQAERGLEHLDSLPRKYRREIELAPTVQW